MTRALLTVDSVVGIAAAIVNLGDSDRAVADSFQAQASEAGVANLSRPMSTTTKGNRASTNGNSASAFRWESEMTPLVAVKIGPLLPAGAGPHTVVPRVPAAIGSVNPVPTRFV